MRRPSDKTDEKPQRVPPPRVPPGALDFSHWPPSKRYAVIGLTGVVGYTNFEFPIAQGTRAAGFLEKDEAYEDVRQVFRSYAEIPRGDREGLRRYLRDLDALGLTVHDGGTLPLAATIELISEWPDHRIAVHADIRDTRYWRPKGVF